MLVDPEEVKELVSKLKAKYVKAEVTNQTFDWQESVECQQLIKLGYGIEEIKKAVIPSSPERNMIMR